MAHTGISIAVDGVMTSNSVVDIEDVLPQDKVDFLRRMYPIHVLERRSGYMEDGKLESMTDEFSAIAEGSLYCACQFFCETACETDCETGGETSGDPGPCDFRAIADWSEPLELNDDGFDLDYIPYPVDTCAGLQVYVEDICQSSCEGGDCQGGVCEGVGCQVWCQNNCQTTCEITGCQVACQATCENPCMTAAQT